MKKSIFSLIMSIFCLASFAQTTSSIGLWLDHLPYNQAIETYDNGELVYVACRQGLYTLDKTTKEVTRYSKLNGLSDLTVSAFGQSKASDSYLLGYENGNLDIIEGSTITNAPDILRAANFSGQKRVNDIQFANDTAYIATNFGIVTFDIRRRITLETIILGPDGTTLKVSQLAITEDSIYAATDKGLFSANRSNPLFFFGNWSRDPSLGNNVNRICSVDGKVFISKDYKAADSIFYKEGGEWKYYLPSDPFLTDLTKLKESRSHLIVANVFSVQAYNLQDQLKFNIQGSSISDPNFSPRSAELDSDPNSFWIADNSQGLYLNFQTFSNQNFVPNGPAYNSVFKMFHNGERLFVAPGALNDVYSPLFNNEGYYTQTEFTWRNYPSSGFGAYRDIIYFVSDPMDPSRYFASAYGSGILEFQDNQLVQLYNETNTGGSMVSINSDDEHRVGAMTFDLEGNMWFTNSLTDQPLCKLTKDGDVVCYSLGSVLGSGTAIQGIMYTDEDQVWIQTRTNGIVVVQINDQGVPVESKSLKSVEGEGNLPTNRVLSFAEDSDGEIWIGTDEGVGVLYSPENIFEPNRSFDAQFVLFEEDGVVQRLLGSETINDIEIDGSNKKWFATATSGVFYTSEDGTEQIYQFNKDNSPLISNNIIDIEIDNVTGMVYFGTDQGIVSFQGVATEGVELHEDVFAYPNPVEPGYSGPILIRGLVTNAQVKITDIEGNLIFQTTAEGGQAIWNATNFEGRRASSGVYIAYVTDDLGQVTAVTKILIVN